jgi:hypothetical protein
VCVDISTSSMMLKSKEQIKFQCKCFLKNKLFRWAVKQICINYICCYYRVIKMDRWLVWLTGKYGKESGRDLFKLTLIRGQIKTVKLLVFCTKLVLDKCSKIILLSSCTPQRRVRECLWSSTVKALEEMSGRLHAVDVCCAYQFGKKLFGPHSLVITAYCLRESKRNE